MTRPAGNGDGKARNSNRGSVLLRDVQFWVPIAVLALGLIVLEWVH